MLPVATSWQEPGACCGQQVVFFAGRARFCCWPFGFAAHITHRSQAAGARASRARPALQLEQAHHSGRPTLFLKLGHHLRQAHRQRLSDADRHRSSRLGRHPHPRWEDDGDSPQPCFVGAVAMTSRLAAAVRDATAMYPWATGGARPSAVYRGPKRRDKFPEADMHWRSNRPSATLVRLRLVCGGASSSS